MAARSFEKKIFRDYAVAIFLAICIAYIFRTYLWEAYRMPSRAMHPAIHAGDTLFVSKLAYKTKKPSYGDIVVFEFPDDPYREYIKRIVATPGDHVQIQQGKLLLNQKIVSQTKNSNDLCGIETLPNQKTYSVCWEPPILNQDQSILLGDDEFFVVGDLRTQPSEVKRLKPFGKITFNSIHGKAKYIWLSIQPHAAGRSINDSWFSRIRFDRMFRRIQ